MIIIVSIVPLGSTYGDYKDAKKQYNNSVNGQNNTSSNVHVEIQYMLVVVVVKMYK
jgi:hypothetical protein